MTMVAEPIQSGDPFLTSAYADREWDSGIIDAPDAPPCEMCAAPLAGYSLWSYGGVTQMPAAFHGPCWRDTMRRLGLPMLLTLG